MHSEFIPSLPLRLLCLSASALEANPIATEGYSMKSIFITALLLTPTVFTFAKSQDTANTKDVVELKAIQQRLIEAWVKQDRATIDSLLADDWRVTDPTGHVLSNAQVMKELDSGDRKLESGAIDDVEVRLFGNVAVVTGRTQATGSYQGHKVSVTLRFTDVFVKRRGAWRAVASQGTMVGQ